MDVIEIPIQDTRYRIVTSGSKFILKNVICFFDRSTKGLLPLIRSIYGFVSKILPDIKRFEFIMIQYLLLM